MARVTFFLLLKNVCGLTMFIDFHTRPSFSSSLTRKAKTLRKQISMTRSDFGAKQNMFQSPRVYHDSWFIKQCLISKFRAREVAYFPHVHKELCAAGILFEICRILSNFRTKVFPATYTLFYWILTDVSVKNFLLHSHPFLIQTYWEIEGDLVFIFWFNVVWNIAQHTTNIANKLKKKKTTDFLTFLKHQNVIKILSLDQIFIRALFFF